MTKTVNTWILSNRQHWTAITISAIGYLLVMSMMTVLTDLVHFGLEGDPANLARELKTTLWTLFFVWFLLGPIALIQSSILQISIQGKPLQLWGFILRGVAVTVLISGCIAFFTALSQPSSSVIFPVLMVSICALAGGVSGWALAQYFYWLERQGRLATREP